MDGLDKFKEYIKKEKEKADMNFRLTNRYICISIRIIK